MSELIPILDTLPNTGARIDEGPFAGLGLHLERSSDKINTLTLSRIAHVPTDEDVTAAANAVLTVFRPPLVLCEERPQSRLLRGRQHFLQRLYWPSQPVTLARPGVHHRRSEDAGARPREATPT